MSCRLRIPHSTRVSLAPRVFVVLDIVVTNVTSEEEQSTSVILVAGPGGQGGRKRGTGMGGGIPQKAIETDNQGRKPSKPAHLQTGSRTNLRAI